MQMPLLFKRETAAGGCTLAESQASRTLCHGASDAPKNTRI